MFTPFEVLEVLLAWCRKVVGWFLWHDSVPRMKFTPFPRSSDWLHLMPLQWFWHRIKMPLVSSCESRQPSGSWQETNRKLAAASICCIWGAWIAVMTTCLLEFLVSLRVFNLMAMFDTMSGPLSISHFCNHKGCGNLLFVATCCLCLGRSPRNRSETDRFWCIISNWGTFQHSMVHVS